MVTYAWVHILSLCLSAVIFLTFWADALLIDDFQCPPNAIEPTMIHKTKTPDLQISMWYQLASLETTQ